MNNQEKLNKTSKQITEWIGTPNSIIAHTVFFIGIFALRFFNLPFENILIILTTLVSLEAIYLAIFIQMTINRTTESLKSVEEDVGEIQKDVEELGGDFEEISKDITEIQEDVQDIGDEVENISKDIDENIEEEKDDEKNQNETKLLIEKMEKHLNVIIEEIQQLKKRG
jgi:uncharacterized membrane protein